MRAASGTGCMRKLSWDDQISCFRNATRSSSCMAVSGIAVRVAAMPPPHRPARSFGKRSLAQMSPGTVPFAPRFWRADGAWQRSGSVHSGNRSRSRQPFSSSLNGLAAVLWALKSVVRRRCSLTLLLARNFNAIDDPRWRGTGRRSAEFSCFWLNRRRGEPML
jgi:hypothetical protein